MASKIRDYIESLPVYEMPRHYGWKYRDALSVEDIGFPYVCDCLHKKKYTEEGAKFPPKFDTVLLYKMFYLDHDHKIVHKFLRINPRRIIMAQRYIGKGRLLQMLDSVNPDPVRLSRYGDYYINHNGHHRMCLSFIRGQTVYVESKEYSLI